MPPVLIATVSYLQCYVATRSCQHIPSQNPSHPSDSQSNKGKWKHHRQKLGLQSRNSLSWGVYGGAWFTAYKWTSLTVQKAAKWAERMRWWQEHTDFQHVVLFVGLCFFMCCVTNRGSDEIWTVNSCSVHIHTDTHLAKPCLGRFHCLHTFSSVCLFFFFF